MSVPVRRPGVAIGRCTGTEGGRPKLRLEGGNWVAGTITGGHQEGDLLYVGFTKPEERRGALVLGPVDPYLSFKEGLAPRSIIEWGLWGCAPSHDRNTGGSTKRLQFGEEVILTEDEEEARAFVPFGAELRVVRDRGYLLGLDLTGEPVLPAKWAILRTDGTAEGTIPVVDLGEPPVIEPEPESEENLLFNADFEADPEDPIFVNVPYRLDILTRGAGGEAAATWYVSFCSLGVETGYSGQDTAAPNLDTIYTGPPADTDVTADVWDMEED